MEKQFSCEAKDIGMARIWGAELVSACFFLIDHNIQKKDVAPFLLSHSVSISTSLHIRKSTNPCPTLSTPPHWHYQPATNNPPYYLLVQKTKRQAWDPRTPNEAPCLFFIVSLPPCTHNCMLKCCSFQMFSDDGST